MDAVGLEAEMAEARLLVADLQREAEAIAEATALGPDDEHDAEGSTIGFERRRVDALLEHAEARLASLEAAIERQQAGTYGRCSSCGGEIGAERLAVLPAAELCVGCARRGPRA